jgi:hypothetical protein
MGEDIRAGSGASIHGIGGSLDLGFAVAKLGQKVDDLRDYWERYSDVVYQTPLTAQVTGTTATANPSNPNDGANTTNSNSLGPDSGTCWSVRRLSIIGYTAGTVTLYINALEPVAQWIFGTTPNPFFQYSKGSILLQPGDRLTLGATGVTGTALLFGVTDTFPYWYLRKYLD